MKILFTGLPYFGKKLVQELNQIDPSNKYVFCDTYYSWSGRLGFLIHLLTAKKVVSFNGVSSKSKALDWALRFKKPLIMQWHGSDVLTLQKNKLQNTFTNKYIEKATSFTDADWLKDELISMNVQASILHFKFAHSVDTNVPFKTANVVTYVAQNNESFYGIESIEMLAEKFPDTIFHVAGTTGTSRNTLANVKYYGWVSKQKMQELLDDNAIYIRLTRHDGYSLSILEALANGNYVIWNNPHPMTRFADQNDALVQIFSQTVDHVNSKNLEHFTENSIWVRENHNREKILKNYIAAITQ